MTGDKGLLASDTFDQSAVDLLIDEIANECSEPDPENPIAFAAAAEQDAKVAAALAARAYFRARAVRMALEEQFAARALPEIKIAEAAEAN